MAYLSSELAGHSRGGDRGSEGGGIGLGDDGSGGGSHGGSGVGVGGISVGYGGVVVGQGSPSVAGVSVQIRCSSHDGLGLFSEANCQNGGENELQEIIHFIVWLKG